VAGRELPPTSAFAADDGAADPVLAAVLDRFARGASTLAEVVAALVGARVLVPVLAVQGEDGAGEGVGDRHATTGVVAVSAPDGRTALPVFTSVAALSAWHPRARPVPADGPRAAAAVIQEGWDLLVLDPAGPVTVVVPRPAVRALATGAVWLPAVVAGTVRADVRDAVVRATAGAHAVLAVDAVPGARAEVAVLVSVRPGLTRTALDAVLAEVGARLAADPEVASAVDTLELRVQAADGE